MLTTADAWALSSYTNDTWTDIVDEVATLASILITNTTANVITGELRVEAAAAAIAQVMPISSLQPYASYAIDIRSLNLITGWALQGKFSAAGVNVLVSGAV